MSGRVFVTGGTGFVGTAVIEELISRNYSVNALVRNGKLRVSGANVREFRGDLFDSARLDEALRECIAVIHLVGIIMEKPSKGITFERIHHEGTRSVVDATQRAGVRRYVHMSALGSRADAVSEYHKTKFSAEEYVRASGLEYTIFRPSLIHGPHGEFMQMEAKWAKKAAPPFLFMPYFGAGLFGTNGAGMLQPVYVKDVARAFVDALEKPNTIGETFPIGGTEQVSWPELHRISAEAIVGHKRWVMPIPAWYAKAVTQITPGFLLPFNRDQVIMSQEPNTCDLSKFQDAFGWSPAPFAETLRSYASQIAA